MKKEKLRNEIKEEHKWDLTILFKDEKEFNDSIRKSENDLKTFIKKYKSNIAKDLFSFLEDQEQLEINFSKIMLYTHLLIDTDTTNKDSKKLELKANRLAELFRKETSFIESEILKLDYKKLIKEDSRLEKYTFMLDKLFRYKDHILSEEEEALIAKASNALGLADEVFGALDNSDIDLGMIELKDGSKVELTNSNYSLFIKDNARDIRKQAFNKMYDYFKKHEHTIAALYLGQIKENFFFSEVRSFKDPLEQALYGNNIPKKVYTNLIDSVKENLKPLQEYLKIKKKLLKLDEMHMYDIYVNPEDKTKSKYSYDEAKEIVLEALKPLGEDYQNVLKEAFNNKWIDVYPSKGKRSGAYANGTYGYQEHILLNYNDSINDVSTLAHELGHAIHSKYANSNQSYTYHWYTIFLAEIASTVNEVLLSDYLIKNAKDNEEKKTFLFDFLEKNRATLYRQTMFAEFEYLMHNKYKDNVPITLDELCNTYYDLNKIYFGKDIEVDDTIKYEWMRIPHFYSSFYVYQYATGISAAFAIAYDILNGKENAKEKYLDFLKSGGSKFPLDTLKEVGVDMTKREPIEKATKIFNDRVEQLKELLKDKE